MRTATGSATIASASQTRKERTVRRWPSQPMACGRSEWTQSPSCTGSRCPAAGLPGLCTGTRAFGGRVGNTAAKSLLLRLPLFRGHHHATFGCLTTATHGRLATSLAALVGSYRVGQHPAVMLAPPPRFLPNVRLAPSCSSVLRVTLLLVLCFACCLPSSWPTLDP